MKNTMEYKGYVGSVEISEVDDCLILCEKEDMEPEIPQVGDN